VLLQMAQLLPLCPFPLLTLQPFELSVLPLTVNEYPAGPVVVLASVLLPLLFPHLGRVPVVQ